MWSDFRDNGTTNQVIMPNEGIIGVIMPTGSEICAYVNDNVAPMHHLHVRAGDRVHFEIKKYPETPGNLTLQFDGRTFTLPVPEVVSGKTDYKEIESVVVSHNDNSFKMTPVYKTKQGEVQMAEEYVKNVITGGGGYDGGYGGMGMAAMIPLLAASGLFGGRRDGFNNDNCEAANVAVMNAGFDGINHNINTSMVGLTNQLGTVNTGLTNQMNNGFGGQRDLDLMQKLGNIEGDIWKAEGQVQLAVAQAQSDINNRISDGLQAAINGQGAIRKDISDAIQASLVSQADIKNNITAGNAITQLAVAQNKYELSREISNDGEKTRALIVRQYEDTLNRQLAVAQDALLEQRQFARSRDVEVNVAQTVNQVQAQAQAQQQQQLTNQLLNAILCQAQVAQATNQSLIIGNTGAVVGGAQNANPTNVRA